MYKILPRFFRTLALTPFLAVILYLTLCLNLNLNLNLNLSLNLNLFPIFAASNFQTDLWQILQISVVE
jgi:hypothetical protein